MSAVKRNSKHSRHSHFCIFLTDTGNAVGWFVESVISACLVVLVRAIAKMCRGFHVIRRGMLPVTVAAGKAMDETCNVTGSNESS